LAVIINEQQAVEQNIFLHEQRLKKPTVRMLDSTPTFVTYYSIDNGETTADDGYKDVHAYIGSRSPIRFNKINNFPIYNIDQIVLQLQDNDQGLDSSYEGEATIVAGTIKPNHNDYFKIPTLHGYFLFRVTDFAYDTLLPDNYYKIMYKLEYNDIDMYNSIDDQVLVDNQCILENIGTDEKCIIESAELTDIAEIENMYRRMCVFYKGLFYNERHNVFLGPKDANYFYYDPLQAVFVNKHSLFNSRNDYKVLILTDQYADNLREYKYNRSVYRLMEERNLKLLNNFKYMERPGITLTESSFYRWRDRRVLVLDNQTVPRNDSPQVFSNEFIASVKNNGFPDSDHAKLLQKFLRKEEIRIKDIPLTLGDDLLYMNNSLEVFLITPLVLYAIRESLKEIKKIRG
jgi:hypothetical protein